MADESLTFRAFGQDVSAGRMFGDLGDKADDAGDSIHGLGDDSKDLDARLAETRLHVRALIEEFDRTGDTSLFRDIRRDRSTISMIESMRKELRGIGDDGDSAGRRFGTEMSRGLADTIGALPSQLKGVGIIALVGVAAAAAPAVGAAIAGAVIGGIGAGGIIGGIALAAQDSRVKSEGTKLGQALLGDLKNSASPFVGPLLAEFGELGEIGASFTADLHKGFVELAPLVKPLVEGLRGLLANLGPGLERTFEAAAPAIRAVANELPEVGDALSDMLETMAKDDRATQGLIGLLHVVEDLTRATGFFVGYLEYQYDWLTTNGDKLNDIQDRFGIFGATWGLTTSLFADESSDVIDSLNDARDATGDFNTSVVGLSGSMYDVVTATDAARNALVEFAKTEQDQFDPMANLVHRLQDVKAAQKDYTDAVHDHGRKSPEAKDADLKLAEAILAANSAAASASGTFNGKLDPALRNTLIAGGMTEAQLRDIETQFTAAQTAGNKFAQVYTAQARLEFTTYRAGERDPGGSAGAALRNFVSSTSRKDPGGAGYRASGGPTKAGRTYWVGERGPELWTESADGYIHDAQASKAMMSGASGGSTLDVNVSVQGSAHARDLVAQLVLETFRVDASFREAVAGYVRAPS